MKLQQAQRSQVKLRIGLSGPSGYGKTYSALLLAYGITNDWNKIAVIDTENNSASLYSHLGEFNVLSLDEPYSPERYVKAIQTCEEANMEVIIVDSISHEWSGKGGCLELHEKLGGRFQDWAKITPLHNQFLDALIQSKSHIIATTRRKVDYSLDRDMNGKTKVMKLGTKEITREGFEYELTVNFELINDNHLVKASKDRTGLFMDKPEFVINHATGRKLKNWCAEGISLEMVKKEISKCHHLAGLKHLYRKYPALSKEIYPLIMERKRVIEDANDQIIDENKVEQQKAIENGINHE
ncbi:ATP-binding protein [Salegentibacter mishustinae]|jgi:KaiC/GvpD/RAD55 family RecA-like ATPase|uniref:AAA family ATPase n=1 Tax=Salegentibacter mishustinae TaxID=270918 RepID=UPI001CE1B224|nr:AAA family ATPase [Salegentibacter mishustinae]UBZ08264.1 ATP-binding protein [Salegentibacter mishustinae]